MEIKDRTVLVTGGGSGLGAATARHLAKKGAKVAILDFDEAKGQKVAQDINALMIKTDVSDEAQIEAAIDQVAAKLGPARVAINCAGVGLAARIVGRDGKLSTDLFEKTLKINLFGSYYIMSHAVRHMMALDLEGEERGVIINTSSAAYQDGQVGQSAYAASKGAIASMSLPAARELSQFHIRVMAIAPGLFHTPMMESLPQEVTDKIIANIPFPKRLGQATEYARLAAHIIENTYLNGEVIRIDAATRLPPR